MAWLIGICCALLALGLLFRYPLQTIGVVVVVVGGVWLLIDSNAKNNQRRYEQARSLVQANEIAFSDMRFGSSFGSSWTLTGNATNHSAHTIVAIELLVFLENCPSGSGCLTIGQYNVHNSINIPPGQMRALNGYASFSNLPALDGWRWNYRINAIVAQ